MVRLLTFAAVIMVHSLAFTEQPGNRVAAAALMLLQFGREVFFILTAFVLVYSCLARRSSVGRFWGRRILYVALPFVAWSAIYYAYSVLGPQHLRASLSAFGVDLLSGGAMYHLYFLLVTLQLYLVFPLLMSLVSRSASRAWAVLGLVSIANVAWLAVLQWVPPPSGAGSWFWTHAYEILPTYAMYVLAGCYTAWHLDKVQAFVARHQRSLLAVAAVCAAGAIGAYAAQLRSDPPRAAASVLQPATVLSCLAALICLYILGSRWASGPRRYSAAVAALSDVSFGVYLSHPLVLQLLLDHGLGNNSQQLPAALATAIGWMAAACGGVALSVLARHSALSLALTGRPHNKHRLSGAAAAVPSGPPRRPSFLSNIPGLSSSRLRSAGEDDQHEHRPGPSDSPIGVVGARADRSRHRCLGHLG